LATRRIAELQFLAWDLGLFSLPHSVGIRGKEPEKCEGAAT